MNRIPIKYPFTLPYSRSVVAINNLLSNFLSKNLDYWQFLLSSAHDFTFVSEACDEIFFEAIDIIEEYIKINEKKHQILKKAQVCKDLEFMKKSMPWFKRIIVRRTTYGAGKISVGGFNQWFRLNAE